MKDSSLDIGLDIAVVGMGYVGLPLACLLSSCFKTTGYDVDTKRIGSLQTLQDNKKVVRVEVLRKAVENGLCFTNSLQDIADKNLYIIAVPTPTDSRNHPDLFFLRNASAAIGKILKKGDVVVFESTVYPGVTEEECLPILEENSGLSCRSGDFGLGYSPERINPGDTERTVEKITKIISGSDNRTIEVLRNVYGQVISAGLYEAPSIRVAEAAKIVENCQRDVNIAFFNELARIFALMDIDTHEVIQAAASKWNFMALKPGLVGGHCIGVDPYYLIDKSQMLGYSPNILKQSRMVNDSMGVYVAEEVLRLMNKKGIMVKSSSILILGFAFKENCADIRNTKVIDIYKTLSCYSNNIVLVDPWVEAAQVQEEYGIVVHQEIPAKKYDAVILAVGHEQFLDFSWQKYLSYPHVLFDVQGKLPLSAVDARL